MIARSGIVDQGERTKQVRFDEAVIDKIFADYSGSRLPGVVVGVAVGGVSLYRKGFGVASIERPVALTPSTRLRIASISKHFTCLCYLLLCEEGRASLDDPLTRWLPELAGMGPPPSIEQVMRHVSGLRNAGDWFFYDHRARVTGADMLQFYCDVGSVNAPAGTVWQYNDGAYFLLGLVIERIANRPLGEVLRDRVLTPAGLNDTELRPWDDKSDEGGASHYMLLPDGSFEQSLRFNEGGGQGGMVSTVDDMLRWLRFVDQPTIGSPHSWQCMKSPHLLANGTTSRFGLSLINGNYRGVPTLWHSGMLPGTTSQLLKVPAADLDIIIITNRRDAIAPDLANQVVDACLADLEPLPTLTAPAATGVFFSNATGRVVELHAEGGVQVATIDGAERVVQPSDRYTFHTTNYLDQVIEVDERSSARSIRLTDFGDIDVLHALESPRRADPAKLVGEYRFASEGMKAAITADGGHVRLRVESRFGVAQFDLACLAERVWRARRAGPLEGGGILTFGHSFASFEVTTTGTTALPFERDVAAVSMSVGAGHDQPG